jgi:hypothetical protein
MVYLKVRGFHFYFHEAEISSVIKSWNVKLLRLSKEGNASVNLEASHLFWDDLKQFLREHRGSSVKM